MDNRQPTGAARAASYLNALTRASKTPGIEYVVVDATDVVFEYAGGWADIRRQAPVDTATTPEPLSQRAGIRRARRDREQLWHLPAGPAS
jgi:hypothetical protein